MSLESRFKYMVYRNEAEEWVFKEAFSTLEEAMAWTMAPREKHYWRIDRVETTWGVAIYSTGGQ